MLTPILINNRMLGYRGISLPATSTVQNKTDIFISNNKLLFVYNQLHNLHY